MFEFIKNMLGNASAVNKSQGNAKCIASIADVKVYWDGNKMWYIAGMAIDADGSPRAYHPNDIGIDKLAYAGKEGNWWGIATNKFGIPYIQTENDPFPGYYISKTSYERKKYKENDPNRYLDSEKIPFVVLPSHIRKMVPPKFLGCKCLVKNLRNGKICNAVLADFGPKNKIGEGSIALANELGIKSSPKDGGTSDHIIFYEIYPGIPAVVNGESFSL